MNHLFKFGTYGHSLENRHEMYIGVKRTLRVGVLDSVNNDRIAACEHVQNILNALGKEIENQYQLHPEDRK